MKAIHHWWVKWGLVDLITLGLGLILTIGYVRYQSRSGDDPLRELWPGAATVLLEVWLTVRIIDALIEKRQLRARVREGVAGNLNYLMTICQRMVPNFDPPDFVYLENEIRYFNEKRKLKAKRFQQTFSASEQAAVESVLNKAEQLLTDGKRAAQAREETNRIRNTARLWSSESGVEEPVERLRHYLSASEIDGQKFMETMASARKQIQATADSAIRQAATEFTDFVENYVKVRLQCEQLVKQITTEVATFRTVVWAEE